MKSSINKLWVVFTIAICFTSAFFYGCKKDPVSTPITVEVNKYFNIEGATLVEDVFPAGAANGPSIETLSGNSYVLPGGSNVISIQSQADFSHVLVGIDGKGGYYKIAANSTKELKSAVMVFLLLNTQLPDSSFTILFALQNAAGVVGSRNTLGVEMVEAGTGKLQVSLSWEKAQDVDLYLVEPGGEVIYYGNSYSENGGELDVDSNAGCSIDNINNENITYGDTAVVAAGQYIVRVNLWSECNVTAKNNYVVSARVNGNLVATSINTNPYYGFYPENSEGMGGGSEAGVEVIKFTVGASKEFPTTTYARFKYSAQPKVMRSNK